MAIVPQSRRKMVEDQSPAAPKLAGYLGRSGLVHICMAFAVLFIASGLFFFVLDYAIFMERGLALTGGARTLVFIVLGLVGLSVLFYFKSRLGKGIGDYRQRNMNVRAICSRCGQTALFPYRELMHGEIEFSCQVCNKNNVAVYWESYYIFRSNPAKVKQLVKKAGLRNIPDNVFEE